MKMLVMKSLYIYSFLSFRENPFACALIGILVYGIKASSGDPYMQMIIMKTLLYAI